MRKQSSQTIQNAWRRASVGLHSLVDELRLLMSGLPDPKDAFDPDELPLTFILRRDSRRARRRTARRHAPNEDVSSHTQGPDDVC